MKLEIIQGHQKRNWRDDKHNEKNTYQLFLFQLILTEWSSPQKVVNLLVKGLILHSLPNLQLYTLNLNLANLSSGTHAQVT